MSSLGIETGSRFVQNNDLRSSEKPPCDLGPSPFSSGKSQDFVLFLFSEMEEVEKFFDLTTLLLLFAALYGFTAIGDSAVLSTAMTESVPPEVLGRALAVRSILGIGVGALAPFAFGSVLDVFEPGQGWGWAGAGLVLRNYGNLFRLCYRNRLLY